jgi:glycosyltransferase involved in cell wall biosynthesis
MSKSVAENAHTDSDSHQVQRELLRTRTEVLHLEAQLERIQNDLASAQNIISTMQSSAFWKLRNIWMRTKLGFSSRNRSDVMEPEVSNSHQESNPPARPDVALAGTAPSEALEIIADLYREELKHFLAAMVPFNVPAPDKLLVSVLLVAFDQPEFIYQCLRTLCGNLSTSLEVIIVDNASRDETYQLLDRLRGAQIIRNVEEETPWEAVKRAAHAAHGEYLLLLDKTVQVMPGAITSALAIFETETDIGAVGAKAISPTGVLLEAGGIVFPDQRHLSYGAGDSPDAAQYCFERDVADCSGAFLLTRRDLFVEACAFGSVSGAAEYCLYLRNLGKRVVYNPTSVLLHFTHAPASSKIADQNEAEDTALVLRARNIRNAQGRILVIDDRVPHEALGAGFPRARRILFALDQLGYLVTMYPTTEFHENWFNAYQDIPKRIELMLHHGREKLTSFLEERQGYYDAIIISRPENMAFCLPILKEHPRWFSDSKIIYDAEAIFSQRIAAKRHLDGQPMAEDEIRDATNLEISLARDADAVLSVSPAEREILSQSGGGPVYTLGHAVDVSPTPRRFEDRSNLLFVGALHALDAPNADSVLWFAREVLPILRSSGHDIQLTVVGPLHRDVALALAQEDIEAVGPVDDLTLYYDQARIFVAPTRFAAGIPLKVLDAAAHGLPVVCTSLLATQLGWEAGKDLMTADDPKTMAMQCLCLYENALLWQHMRKNALERIEQEYTEAVFITTLKKVFSVTLDSARA